MVAAPTEAPARAAAAWATHTAHADLVVALADHVRERADARAVARVEAAAHQLEVAAAELLADPPQADAAALAALERVAGGVAVALEFLESGAAGAASDACLRCVAAFGALGTAMHAERVAALLGGVDGEELLVDVVPAVLALAEEVEGARAGLVRLAGRLAALAGAGGKQERRLLAAEMAASSLRVFAEQCPALLEAVHIVEIRAAFVRAAERGYAPITEELGSAISAIELFLRV